MKMKGKRRRRSSTATGSQSTPTFPAQATSSVRPPILLATKLLRDANVGASVLTKVCHTTWWEWSRGSTLIFWRWPAGEQQRKARDRMEAYFHSKPPLFHQQVPQPKQDAFELLLPKFQSIIQ